MSYSYELKLACKKQTMPNRIVLLFVLLFLFIIFNYAFLRVGWL